MIKIDIFTKSILGLISLITLILAIIYLILASIYISQLNISSVISSGITGILFLLASINTLNYFLKLDIKKTKK